MKLHLFTPVVLLMFTACVAERAAAHCQVPCGIYGDERRFEELLEDTETISKSIAQIGELAGTHDATGHNQLARWVSTKEDHASNIQEIVAQYFLAQRINAEAENYTEQLQAAHAVIVAAMKCKQAADPATADTLKEAILDLYRAYEGKEPQLEEAAAAAATEAAPLATVVTAEQHHHDHADHGEHHHAE